jgi:heme a synthase
MKDSISQSVFDSMYNFAGLGAMKPAYHPGLHQFAVFVVCWTVLLLIAGALVTSNEAALSVPDWPKSYGSWTPPMVGGVFYEHSHRVIAGGLGIWTLVLAVVIWAKEERRWLRWFGVIAVAGVVAQAILGGQVVIQLLHYWLPVIHACFAQIVFAAVLSIAVFTSRWWISDRPVLEDRGSPSIHSVALLNSLVVFFQVFLGAGFRHKEIPIWPHAAGSLIVLGTITWTAVALRKRFEQSPELSKARTLLHSLFGLQFLLGIGAYWSRLATADAPQPMPVMVSLTVIHTVVGALLFATSVLVILLCHRLVARRREVAVATAGQAAVE